MLEVVETLALVSGHYVANVLFRVDVADLRARIVGHHLVADGVDQVGFTEADAAVEEQRVIRHARVVRHLDGGGARQLVGFTRHKTVEGQVGVDAALLAARRGADAQFRHAGLRLRGARAGRAAIRIACRGAGGDWLFRQGQARIEHELHFRGRFEVLNGQRRDAAGELGLDPIELEAIGRSNAQLALFVVERDKRFDPRTELLRCQLQFQLRGTGLPEIIHVCLCEKVWEGVSILPCGHRVARPASREGSPHVTRYSTPDCESYPQARLLFLRGGVGRRVHKLRLIPRLSRCRQCWCGLWRRRAAARQFPGDHGNP